MRSNALLTPTPLASYSPRYSRNILVRGHIMRDLITEGQLRRELDLVLVRLARCGRAALIEARSQGDRLAGDMFADAQVVASQDLGQLGYERLARRAKVLAIALERVRDGSYDSCEECGGRIPKARRRALPGVTTCLQCQELGESLRARSREAEWMTRRSRIRHKSGRRDASAGAQH
jgi:phage/conjugal plasmid C-4 type zinc finger TraR family protein